MPEQAQPQQPSPEGTSINQIEAAMADMVARQLGERIPELMNYYLGFELGDQNDEGTKAAGVAGFRIGRGVYLVPAIFLNGKIRCLEMILDTRTNRMLSLSKQLVAQLAKGGGLSGTGEPRSSVKGVGSPQMDIYSMPDKVASIVGGGVPDLEFQDVASAFRALGEGRKWAELCRRASGPVKNFLRSRYGDGFEYEVEPQKSAEPRESGEVKVILPSSGEAALLSDGEKVELMESGMIVKDTRRGGLSQVIEGRFRFNAPKVPGIYDIVSSNGRINKMFVAPNPFSVRSLSGGSGRYLVVDPKSGAYFEADGDGAVLAYQGQGSEMATVGDTMKIKPVSSAEVGGEYILVHRGGMAASSPFTVRNKSGGRIAVAGYSPESSIWMEPVKSGAKMPHRSGNSLFVPEGSYGLVKVECARDMDRRETGPSDSGDCRCDRPFGDMLAKVTPMPESGISALYSRGTFRLSVEGKRAAPLGEFTIFSGPEKPVRPAVRLKRAEAIEELMDGYGLGAEDAMSMIKRADGGCCQVDIIPGRALKCPEDLKSAIFPDYDDSYGSTRYTGTPQTIRVSGTYREDVDYEDMDDQFDPDHGMPDFIDAVEQSSEDDGILNRAASNGMKQVFDPAAISMLLRTKRAPQQVAEQWVPKMRDAVDALCRTLVSFYWHNEDFAQDYGRDDLAEFEDMLLGCIRDMGTTVLFLEQRNVGGIGELDAMSETPIST